jgi:hypothetical protein
LYNTYYAFVVYKLYVSIGRVTAKRNEVEQLSGFDLDFLKALKNKNATFPKAIEELRSQYNLSYSGLLEKAKN